ncbi:unnamed protein product [Leptosia nina]|uniref:Uncharacterized protein n=1 Tax=Leptosia nina TaxID=320188 RepID=A0AAV1JND9_9NEOP
MIIKRIRQGGNPEHWLILATATPSRVARDIAGAEASGGRAASAHKKPLARSARKAPASVISSPLLALLSVTSPN